VAVQGPNTFESTGADVLVMGRSRPHHMRNRYIGANKMPENTLRLRARRAMKHTRRSQALIVPSTYTDSSGVFSCRAATVASGVHPPEERRRPLSVAALDSALSALSWVETEWWLIYWRSPPTSLFVRNGCC
jgi:hypothetical protein